MTDNCQTPENETLTDFERDDVKLVREGKIAYLQAYRNGETIRERIGLHVLKLPRDQKKAILRGHVNKLRKKLSAVRST